MEPGFNCSQLCNGSSSFGSQEQHQRALQELCTVTVTSSDRSGKSSPSFSAALLGVVWTFLTGGVLLALFFLVFTIRFRKNRIVKMSSPNLNIVTLLGSGLTYTSAYLFGIQEQSLPSGDSVEKLIQVTEKGMTCSVSRVQSCASLYSDLWLVLILGFKSILLLYGTYLAGLTDNVSSPPVNQSLTLIVGVNLVFLAASTVCLVHRFFRAWHNLLFGFTSGGIFVCTTTINCFIFVPQLRQWKAFEEESQTMSHMAKYFTSPSRSCRSVYSEEQLYQLIGEKNSMKRLLTEKNAVIESLQEQVSSAKEKLMRLMSAESGCDPHAMPPAPCTGSTGQCGDVRGGCCPPDPERDGWHPPCLPLCSNAQDLQKHVSHVSHEPVCSRVMIFDNRDEIERGLKDVQECGAPMGQEQPSEQLPDQDISAGVAWELSPKVSYVSSEKLREILQDLSLDGKTYSPALPGGLPHGSQGPPREQEGMWGAQEGYLGNHTPFSPYVARRRRRIPLSPGSTHCHGHMSPHATCGVKEASGWGCGESAHISLGREGEVAGRRLLHPPAPSPPAISGEACLQPEGWPGWPESQGSSLCILREQQRRQGALRGPAEPSLRSLYYYPDSDSSSISSSEEMFHGCHRPCCELCFQSPRGSLGSSSTDTDTEPSSCTGHRTQHQSGPQPVVNFKEDLKPTFV
ncbi:probable G-protein coupled receptor 156 isoform X2 [Strigops habroptila]|uniref:probable G-protein coupled receptor 156 isoform X2 n=1 Tax=Strigops habroptila TaxID=2489341 RepID=UPI0011D00493|nr:probable G-protein coupled receptor 156 isoform X2 [Strigops habroptila]